MIAKNIYISKYLSNFDNTEKDYKSIGLQVDRHTL